VSWDYLPPGKGTPPHPSTGGREDASDADLDTGIACVEAGGSQFAIAPGGGTSAGAPVWAGIVAMADQYAGRHLGFINPAIYKIGRSARYHRAFQALECTAAIR
jgi:subtilase family serine protease